MIAIRRLCISIIRKKLTKNNVTSYMSTHSPSLGMILNKNHLEIVQDEKRLLDNLLIALNEAREANCEVNNEINLISDSKARIDDMFLLVVVGEFNAGKSSLINALLGDRYLREGPLPTTNNLCLIRRSNSEPMSLKASSSISIDDMDEICLPIPWLEHVVIVDTPGTNALDQRHQTLTQLIVPQADLILFVTSAERPLSQSEGKFLTEISQWGRKLIVVINKIDLLPKEEDRRLVLDYVNQNIGSLLGYNSSTISKDSRNYIVPIFAVSSKLGLDSRIVARGGDPALDVGAKRWLESNIRDLESYLLSQLSESEVIRVKLEKPLIISDRVIAKTLISLESSLVDLQSDKHLVSLISEYMAQFDSSMKTELTEFIAIINRLSDNLTRESIEMINKNYSFSYLINRKKLKQNDYKDQLIRSLTDLINDSTTIISNKVKSQSLTIYQCIYPRASKLGLSTFSPMSLASEIDGQIVSELSKRLVRELTGVVNNNKIHQEDKLVTNALYRDICIYTCLTSANMYFFMYRFDWLLYTGFDVYSSTALYGLTNVTLYLSIYQISKQATRRQSHRQAKDLMDIITRSFTSIYLQHVEMISRRLIDASSTVTSRTDSVINKIMIAQSTLITVREKCKQLRNKIISTHL